MDKFAFTQLQPALLKNNDKESGRAVQADIATYLTNLHTHLESEDLDSSSLTFAIEQLDLLIDHFTTTFSDVPEAHSLSARVNTLLAKTYTLVLSQMLKKAHEKFNIKLIDVTNKMVYLLADVKKLSIKSWYSSLKHMALAFLQITFAQFGGFLNSYKGLLLTTIYKYLTKCHDNYNTAIESGIFKANYFTDMVLTLDIVLSNDNSSNTLDDKLLGRLLKLTKYLTQKNSSHKYIYPLLSVSYTYNILVHLLKSDRYVLSIIGKKNTPSVTSYLTSITSYLNDLITALSTEDHKLRVVISKNIADLLVFNIIVFGVNLGEEEKCFEYTLNYLVVHYTKESHTEEIRTGLIEAIVQLMSKMNLYYTTNTVRIGYKNGINYMSLKFLDTLNIIYYHIFGKGMATNQLKLSKDDKCFKVTDAFENPIEILNQIETLYCFFLREVDSDINRLIVLSKIMYGSTSEIKVVKFPSLIETVPAPDHDADNQYYVLSLLKLSQLLIDQLDEYVLSQQDGISDSVDSFASQLCSTLFELCKHKSFKIRVVAVDSITRLISIKPELSFDILNESLSTLLASFDEGKGDMNFLFNEMHGLAFLIASILSTCPKEHINADFVLQVFSISTNFLKKFNSTVIMGNLFGSGSGSYVSNVNYEKQLVSWIILMGLFNYATEKDGSSGSNFFLLESSQFITIWKNLLTHSMPSDFVQTSTVDGLTKITNLSEIMKLVEIKNQSLVCLSSYINYLSSTRSSVENSSKSSLLTPEIALSLNQIVNKSFVFISNLKMQVSNLTVPPILERTIKLHKLRVYQNLIKLQPFLPKSDSNSNLLLDVVEIVCKSGFKTKKFNTFKVDELLIKSTTLRKQKPSNDIKTIDELPLQSLYTVESNRIKSHLAPLTVFDTDGINRSSFLNDYLMYLYQGSTSFGYTDFSLSPPDLDTMLVDISVEILALSFGFLSSRVQISILENMQEVLFPTSGRASIIAVQNICVSIHSIVSYMRNHSETLEQTGSRSTMELSNSVSVMVIDLMKRIYAEYSEAAGLAELNSDAIGLICSLAASKENMLSDQIAIFIKSIVENAEPNSRSFDSLTLSKISEYSNLMNISNIFSVLLTLMLDPHPLVHASALDSLTTVISSQRQIELIGPLLTNVLVAMENVLNSDEFGFNSPVTVSSNLNYHTGQNSVVLLARLARVVINSSGPTIGLWEISQKQKLKNILFGLINLEKKELEAISRELLKALEELLIFDKSLISMEAYLKLVKFTIINNIKVGVSDGHYIASEESMEIYPVTTSDINWRLALESYNQLLKLGNSIDSEMEQFLWISLEYADSSTVKEVFDNLLKFSSVAEKVQWFEKLVKLFNVNKHVLYEPLLSTYRKRINHSGALFNPMRFRKPVPVKSKPKSKSSTPVPASTVKPEHLDLEIEDEGETFARSEEEPSVKHEETIDSSRNESKPALAHATMVQSMVLENETTKWKFKKYILQLLTVVVSGARNDSRLQKYISTKISELVEIAFICSTSSLIQLRISSLELIGHIIDIFGNMSDPVYPEVSLLGQQSAQITTAIVPAFSRDSNIGLACTAIVLASKLLSSNIGQVSRMHRIVNVLTTSLEEFARAKGSGNETSNGVPKNLKIGEVSVLTTKSQNKLLVYILQAWSRIKVHSGGNPDTSQLVDKYINILTPLWLYSLRDFAMMKYGSQFLVTNADDVDINTYEQCWVDFVEVIGVIANENSTHLNEFLRDDGSNFFLVLFGQCIEHLIKVSSKTKQTVTPYDFRVLDALAGILKLKSGLQLAFDDSIFVEFIDLLDRLVLISDPSFKIKLLELASGVFESYFMTSSSSKSPEELHSDVDKLFELLRINMLAIIQILPFIRDRELGRTPLRVVESHDLIVLKKAFDLSLNMIAYLPEVIQLDLYTCFLFAFTLIYELNNSEIIAILLPTLKKIISSIAHVDSRNSGTSRFFHSIKKHLNVTNKNSILTVFIIVTTSDELHLTEEEAAKVSEFIINGLLSEESSLNTISIQTIKTLIKNNEKTGLILEKLIPQLVDQVYQSKLKEPRLVLEILIVLTRSVSSEKIEGCLKICIPIILWFDDFTSQKYENYLHHKLLDLIQHSPAHFKTFVGSCSGDQKHKLERLVKLASAPETETETVLEEFSHIQLKTFG
ncbi:hypothetical protein KL911_000277 [Ogataea haglerorum]|uniref:uncharacterized protein n=1 Tax=Ogataea haglerorum TaxID=1937702 RepID=UPI001C8B03EC|nr:uncharacterized protein KL911_000277 [Ogataea haglerorum]KAG7759140.1 hypothetical protein KL911_000277 [Ogataea haglerorum]